MAWTRYRIVTVAFVALAACGAPTSPDGCDDPYGREPVALLRVECTPSAAGMECQAFLRESGYCASPDDRNVTGDARWFSSDTSVGHFSPPGVFQTRSAGTVRIHAEYSLFLKSEEQAFAVLPGQPAERLASILIGVKDTTTGTFLADARVDVAAERGNAVTCQTDVQGQCRVWTYLSPVRVTVTKPGYQRAERTLEPRDTCYCVGELIDLTPNR